MTGSIYNMQCTERVEPPHSFVSERTRQKKLLSFDVPASDAGPREQAAKGFERHCEG
jgi:hypothetical protein